MKRIIISLVKIFLFVFTAFGALGVFIMLDRSDLTGVIFYIVWALIGFILLVLLYKHPIKTVNDIHHEEPDISISSQNSPSNITENSSLDLSQKIFDQTMGNLKEDTKSRSSTPTRNSSISLSKPSPSYNGVSSNNKIEHHKVAGTSFRQKEIETLGEENSSYYCSKRELIEDCMTDERIYQYDFFPVSVQLVEDPDNEYDSNAIKVIIDNVHVGYIKKGSCSHIKNLLRHNKISSIAANISGGKYKYISSDYDVDKDKGVYTMETGSVGYFISLDISVNEEGELSPKSVGRKSKTIPSRVDVMPDNTSNSNTILFLDEKTLSSLNLNAFLEYAKMITNSAKGATAENFDAYMEELRLIREETDRRSR